MRGTGHAEVPAYGIADAEHQTEKELRAAWPEALIEVLEIHRAGGGGARIVEEFTVRYGVTGIVSVAAEAENAARREALQAVRAKFQATRFRQIRWEVVPAPQG